MKTRPQTVTDTVALTDRKVLAWLKKHPEFFRHHPSLLNHVVFPHHTDGAASLVERQVQYLQDERRKLQLKIRELAQVARANEQSMHKLHRLLLKLLRCKDLESVLKTLYVSLRAQFKVSAVAIRLCSGVEMQQQLHEFSDTSGQLLEVLKDLGALKQPVCCKLDQPRARLLFDKQAEQLESFALIPLGNNKWQGLICMGSDQTERFSSAHGNELLQDLGETLTVLLNTHIQ